MTLSTFITGKRFWLYPEPVFSDLAENSSAGFLSPKSITNHPLIGQWTRELEYLFLLLQFEQHWGGSWVGWAGALDSPPRRIEYLNIILIVKYSKQRGWESKSIFISCQIYLNDSIRFSYKSNKSPGLNCWHSFHIIEFMKNRKSHV